MREHKAIIFSAFVFLAGISSGVFLEISMNPADKLQMADFLGNYLFQDADPTFAYPAPFLSSAAGNLFLLLLIFLSGLSAIGFPAAYIVLLYKGASLGFAAGVLIESFAFKGALSLALTMFPQNIVIIPAFVVAAAAACQYGFEAFSAMHKGHRKRMKNAFRQSGKRYLITNAVLAGVILLGCAIEGLLALIVV